MLYYFYIARCADDTLYSGITTDLRSREQAHNDGKGAKYTRARRPIKIVYSEKLDSRSVALVREARVKQYSRAQKLVLISK